MPGQAPAIAATIARARASAASHACMRAQRSAQSASTVRCTRATRFQSPPGLVIARANPEVLDEAFPDLCSERYIRTRTSPLAPTSAEPKPSVTLKKPRELQVFGDLAAHRVMTADFVIDASQHQDVLPVEQRALICRIVDCIQRPDGKGDDPQNARKKEYVLAGVTISCSVSTLSASRLCARGIDDRRGRCVRIRASCRRR